MTRSQERYDAVERKLEIPMLILAVVFVPVALIPATRDLSDGWLAVFLAVDIAIWVAFAAEFVTLFVLAPDRRRMVRRHALDLVVLILPFLRVFQIGRTLRVLRLTRLLALSGRVRRVARSMRTGEGFAGFLLVVVAILVLGGLAVEGFEQGHPDANIESPADGIWWAFVTATTVGYGDRFPVTAGGRILGIALMLVGVALLSVVTANIAALFIRPGSNGDGTDDGSTGSTGSPSPTDARVDQLHERLDRIEALLAGLAATTPRVEVDEGAG